MSIGNLKDNGNKGNNFPYQRAVLQLLEQVALNSSGINSGGITKIAGSDFTASLQRISDLLSNQILPAPPVGQKYCITQILVTNSSQTVNTLVDLLQTLTIKYSGECGIKGGGFACSFPANNPFIITDTFNIQCLTTGASINVSINGFNAIV